MTTMTQPSPRQLAERIAEDLFTLGDQHAVELEFVTTHGVLFGLTKQAVIDRVTKILEAAGREA